jgi:hypothetical protein
MTFTGKYILRDVLSAHFVVPVDRELGQERKCFEITDEGAAMWHAIEYEEGDLRKFDEEAMCEFVDTLKSIGALA